VMVEGGGGVLGSVFDERLADEVYAFVAPRVIGGREATAPVGGTGPAALADGIALDRAEWIPLGFDLALHGYLPARR
jgi:diaminohydroxyphosphoribosylaminopyrimidine deaminase / 5-amino-6-(5-phosphoribosylamino)uracil reductase